MAIRMLAGASTQMASGAVDSFVFLLDMKYLFEAYVEAALVDRFGASVQAQRTIGHLFTGPVRLVTQKPDYVWRDGGRAGSGMRNTSGLRYTRACQPFGQMMCGRLPFTLN